MKRWNGWGDVATTYPLPESAVLFLEQKIGKGVAAADAEYQQVVSAVPSSKLKSHPLINNDPALRLNHARGQSFPDWVAMRSGQIGCFPDGVAYPNSDEEVRSLLDFARQTDTTLIPYGGGTSVVGHINPLPGSRPNLTLDLSHFNQLLSLDETSRLASLGAGICGPDLENCLNSKGYTLGHFPQSFELSTLGGWIASRSSGQQSYHYGRIEDLVAGIHVETPRGPMELIPLPASAAGPDLRQVILGSEGRVGIITRATLRVRPLPGVERFYGVFFHNWEDGQNAVREIAQARVPVSMARLSNAQETETTLALSGKEALVGFANRGLSLLNYGPERCLLVYGVTGQPEAAQYAHRATKAIIRKAGGLLTGTAIGEMWRKSRFLTPYLRNTLWERGYAIDTLETAVSWSEVPQTAADIEAALSNGLKSYNERVLVLTHLSHIYRDGASIYVTYLFRRAADPGELLERWLTLKRAASQQIVAHKGTISHQHGIGVDHAPYLPAEKGPVGIELLAKLTNFFDPQGILNPGKLLLR